MDLIFPEAELAISQGAHTRRTRVSKVSLCIREQEDRRQIDPSIRSEFLNGKLTVEGELVEECLPSASVIRVGMQGLLKLASNNLWTLSHVLFSHLREVTAPAPRRRLYHWSFIVVGKGADPLGIFPGPAEGQTGVENLLDFLSASWDDLGNPVLTSEGGWKEAALPAR